MIDSRCTGSKEARRSVDPAEQAAFIAGLRKRAEELSANNPILGELRRLGKTMVDLSRKLIAEGSVSPLGGYIRSDQQIIFVETNCADPKQAMDDLVSALREQARNGGIRAAAISSLVEIPPPMGPVMHVRVHLEHATGLAFVNSIPANESELMSGVPGVDGPAIAASGGKVRPIIFPTQV
jgi:hypothetical protein